MRTIVTGPPCSGKSTYVERNAKPDDVILDRDEIARSMGSAGWDHPQQIIDAAEAEMRARMANLPADRSAWIIRTSPLSELDELAEEIGAEVVILDVPPDEAKSRAERDGRPEWTAAAIDHWWDANKDHPMRRKGEGEQPETGDTMSDTMPEPAEAPKPTPPAASQNVDAAPSEPEQFPEDHPLVKALAAQKDEIKALKARAARLDEIEEAQKSEAEKQADALAKAQADAATATAELLRYRAAAAHGITDAEDIELFLTGADKETLERQAKALAARSKPSGPRTPKPDPNQGSPGSSPASHGDIFASLIERHIT